MEDELEKRQGFFEEQPFLFGVVLYVMLFLIYVVSYLLGFVLTLNDFAILLMNFVAWLSCALLYGYYYKNEKMIIPAATFTFLSGMVEIVLCLRYNHLNNYLLDSNEIMFNSHNFIDFFAFFEFCGRGAVLIGFFLLIMSGIRRLQNYSTEKLDGEYSVCGALIRGTGIVLFLALPIAVIYFLAAFKLYSLILSVFLFGEFFSSALCLFVYCVFYTRGKFFVPPIIMTAIMTVTAYPLFTLLRINGFGGHIEIVKWLWLPVLPFLISMWIAAAVKTTGRKKRMANVPTAESGEKMPANMVHILEDDEQS